MSAQVASRRTLRLAGLALALVLGAGCDESEHFATHAPSGALVFHDGSKRVCDHLAWDMLGEGYGCIRDGQTSYHPSTGVRSVERP